MIRSNYVRSTCSCIMSLQARIPMSFSLVGYFFFQSTSLFFGCLREEKCDVILSWYSGSQQPFFVKMTICSVERWKNSMGYRFVPEWNHALKSHTCHSSSFFLTYLQDHDLLRSRYFDTMATQRNDFSTLLGYLFFDYILILQAVSLGRRKYEMWRSGQRAIYILTWAWITAYCLTISA